MAVWSARLRGATRLEMLVRIVGEIQQDGFVSLGPRAKEPDDHELQWPPTDSDWVILQHVHQCNVVYAYTLSNVIWRNIVTVHKQVEIEMEDKSAPPHNFTGLCREVMGLKVTEKDGTSYFAFDAIILIRSGLRSGGAAITYRMDSILSATLAQYIRRCVAGWFFGN
jgi:hypothetical protein